MAYVPGGRLPARAQRVRAAHGFVFRDHSPEELAAIKRWLETGEDDDQLPEAYPRVLEVVKKEGVDES